MMFNSTALTIEAFADHLRDQYGRTYGSLEPHYHEMIAYVGRMALENIANGDAAYHDLPHTIHVTDVGHQILLGKHMRGGRVMPQEWMHVMVALLCHDIGFVRGICPGDGEDEYVIDSDGRMVQLPPGATDASLMAYHVDRGKIFVMDRFKDVELLDGNIVAEYIEYTRFPVPDDGEHEDTRGYPGMVRAADLIGQMADPDYVRKSAALYVEFQETGMNEQMGYASAADLRENYPVFFWSSVAPLVQDAMAYLRVTQEGKLWLACLYSHIFAEEHRVFALGAERNKKAD